MRTLGRRICVAAQDVDGLALYETEEDRLRMSPLSLFPEGRNAPQGLVMLLELAALNRLTNEKNVSQCGWKQKTLRKGHALGFLAFVVIVIALVSCVTASVS